MGDMETDDFGRIIFECRREMYNIAFGIVRNIWDAEDAVSSAVLKAYEKRDTLCDRNKFRSWIYVILVNEARQLIRKNKKVVVTDFQEMQTEVSVADESSEMRELIDLLQRDLKDVIVLYYYMGYSTQELAIFLHIPRGTVMSRLSRARQRLREMM